MTDCIELSFRETMSWHLASSVDNGSKSPKRLSNAFFDSKSNYELVPSQTQYKTP